MSTIKENSTVTQTSTNLCSRCSILPWEALRSPRTSLIQEMQFSFPHNPGDNDNHDEDDYTEDDLLIERIECLCKVPGVFFKAKPTAKDYQYHRINLGDIPWLETHSTHCPCCNFLMESYKQEVQKQLPTCDKNQIIVHAVLRDDFWLMPAIVSENEFYSMMCAKFRLNRLCFEWMVKPTFDQEGMTVSQSVGISQFDPKAGREEDPWVFTMRNYLPARFSMEPIKSALRNCYDSHPEDGKRSERYRHMPDFCRLIDVQHNCLVNGYISKHAYCALSYCWDSTNVKLTTTNYDTLYRPGSLSKLSLPKTISDAISLTVHLDFTYLWVDALCIVQNDIKDLKVQLGIAGKIYANAELTIVAAGGSGASYGIPGYRQDRLKISRPAFMVNTKSASPMWVTPNRNIHDNKELTFLNGTRWAKRGWTYQEIELSRRVLTISDYGVLLFCGKGQIFYDERRLMSPCVLARTAWADRLCQKEQRYRFDGLDSLRADNIEFLQKNLTMEGDAFVAFSGLVTLYSSVNNVYCLWGFPVKDFGTSMLWKIVTGYTVRDEMTTVPIMGSPVNTPFPTWSVFGWKGRCYYERGFNDGQILCTEFWVFRVWISENRQHSNPRFVPVQSLTSHFTESSLTETLDHQRPSPSMPPSAINPDYHNRLLAFKAQSIRIYLTQGAAEDGITQIFSQQLDVIALTSDINFSIAAMLHANDNLIMVRLTDPVQDDQVSKDNETCFCLVLERDKMGFYHRVVGLSVSWERWTEERHKVKWILLK